MQRKSNDDGLLLIFILLILCPIMFVLGRYTAKKDAIVNHRIINIPKSIVSLPKKSVKRQESTLTIPNLYHSNLYYNNLNQGNFVSGYYFPNIYGAIGTLNEMSGVVLTIGLGFYIIDHPLDLEGKYNVLTGTVSNKGCTTLIAGKNKSQNKRKHGRIKSGGDLLVKDLIFKNFDIPIDMSDSQSIKSVGIMMDPSYELKDKKIQLKRKG